MASKIARNIVLHAVAICTAMTIGGCENMENVPKNIGDYLNLRNSFLDPSQVGRFDKANPWGSAKPVTWPILEQLDVVDEPQNRWTTATDPVPADLIEESKEYIIGEGDALRVQVFELVTPGVEWTKDVQVNELGDVTGQNVGQIHVAGLTPTQLEEKLGQIAVEKGLLLPKGNGNPGPQVSVQLLQSHTKTFSVIGQVNAPNSYFILGTDFRLLDALAMAHDVVGGTQPGLDYLYVIRPPKGAGLIPATRTSNTPAAMPAASPLDTLDTLEKATTKPAPTTSPGGPGTEGPQFLHPLPTAVVMPSDNPVLLAQADLDAALGAGASTPATRPVAAATPSAPAAAVAPTTSPADNSTNQAVGAASRPGQYIFVDGKWVLAGSAEGSPASGLSPVETVAAATGLGLPRVIRIPMNKLREGDPQYNILIRPGDIINVPNIEPGEFYMMGHLARPGVYSLTGRKVTLQQAVAAAGGLDAVAIPRRCDLIRRIGPNQQVIVQIDLQRIFDGERPDIFLKANDVINVGTDLVAPFLAVTRNAYRASYGWGFVYDRNYYITPTITQSSGGGSPTPTFP